MEEKNGKSLADVVSREEFDEFMQLPVVEQAAKTQEFLDHVHTLWNSISNLYDEYAIPLSVLGMHLELNIFAAGKRITHAELGVKVGLVDIIHGLKEEIEKEMEEEEIENDSNNS